MPGNSSFTGSGSGSGRGLGRGGQGGQGNSNNRGRSRLDGRGAGIGGFCICPGCGAKIEHQPGIPCTEVKCPKCGLSMIRGN